MWWYDFGIFLLRLTMRFGYFLCVLGIVYVALLVFVKDTSYMISIMDRPRRVIKLTEPGRELLERNLRGKCGSALKAANVVANKLSVLLQNADKHDVRRVEGLYDELKCNVANVLAHQSEYEQKFAGDMDVLASFGDWFQPRFKVLQDIVTYTCDWLNQLTGTLPCVEAASGDDDIVPEDSVSQVFTLDSVGSALVGAGGSRFTSHSRHSSSKSHSSRGSRGTSSSVKSAFYKESLKKASLMAEASTLARKQEFLRREFELNLEKETLDLHTKLAIASAREGVLLDVGPGGSNVSGHSKASSGGNTKVKTLISQPAGLIHAHNPFVKSDVCLSHDQSSAAGPLNAQSGSMSRSVLGKPAHTVTFRQSDTATPLLTPVSEEPHFSCPYPPGVQQNMAELVSTPQLFNHPGVSTESCVRGRNARACYGQGLNMTTSPSLHVNLSSGTFVSGPDNTTEYMSQLPNTDHGTLISTPTMTSKHTLNPSSPAFIPHNSLQTSGNGVGTKVSTQPYGAGISDTGVNTSVMHESQFSQMMDKFNEVLTDQRNRLPEVGISKFAGDPLEYSSFVRSFESRVASRTRDNSERLFYLEQFTSGVPRDLVRSCMHMPADTGYFEARKCLESRFGDQYLLANSYLKKLETWPEIRNNDVKRFDQFTTFLIGCRNAMSTSCSIKELDFPSSLKLVVNKLPGHVQERWSREADRILHQEGGSITFSRLVSFLDRENRVKLNPVFGKTAISAGHSDNGKSGATQSKKKTTSAATVTKPQSNASGSSSSVQVQCVFCPFRHPFKSCRKFRKLLHKDKIAFLIKHRMCFGCLEVGHMQSECTNKSTCEVCAQSHPTSLHRVPGKMSDQSQSEGNTSSPPVVPISTSQSAVPSTSATVTTNGEIQSQQMGLDTMPIVPVKLRSTHSDVEVCTYAFLDSGSSDTFICEQLMKQLGAKGKKTQITLTTLNNDQALTTCYAVSNLEVCGLNESQYIALPTTYTQEYLPVTRQQIPLQEDIDPWVYLSHIQLPSLNSDVGILIGNNVPKATEPWEVTNSVGNGPYAVRTILGWAINGPLRNVAASGHIPSVSVHRIQQTSGLEKQVERFFSLDYSERQVFSGGKCHSVEDKQFLEMVGQQSVLRHGRYEICLPLRDSSVPLPNNRPLELQRMKGLQKKFLANESYKKRYTDFIEDLFVKGHASKVPTEEVDRSDGFLWYLPHHGVVHPRKDKLRVVLDASAKFAGTSLNDRLLSGPDLTNNLIGVLLRFREGRVAFISDIECMFYQVRVPIQQRDLLRFLWWPGGDVTNELIECRMHTHIFGATSSPAVASYALRKTALDNAAEFSLDAVETVNNSFYVDDCLKSVPTVEEGLRLSSELRALTLKGGFRLTKWVSNSPELLSCIPEIERSKNMNDIGLDCGVLLAEKALGVVWAVETDMGFMLRLHRSLVPDEVFSRQFPHFMILWEWLRHSYWLVKWLFSSHAVWSWDGMSWSLMICGTNGNPGSKSFPFLTDITWSGASSQRVLEMLHRPSYITLLTQVSMVMGVCLIYGWLM